MAKRAGLLAMGGHIATQNTTFYSIMTSLPEWEFFALNNGFQAFESRELFELEPELLIPNFAGFYGGAARATLIDKETGEVDPEQLDRAVEFIKAAKLDYLVGSAGDDHGAQLGILAEALKDHGIHVLVANKTMDGDKGGIDGKLYTHEDHGSQYGPFAHTTNGFHTAIEAGLEQIMHHFAGAWTNEVVTIVSPFGRDANWVNAALAWYGFADLALYGELPVEHPRHSIQDILVRTEEAMVSNQQIYGRRFATIVVSEGTRVEGIEQESSVKDPHGNSKLDPELLCLGLKAQLSKYGISSQTLTLTYELRNHPPSEIDGDLAILTADELVKAMNNGQTGMEAVLKFQNNQVVSDLEPIEWASPQRLTRYYEQAAGRSFYSPSFFRPLKNIEYYFHPLLGERGNLSDYLPTKPRIIHVP